MQIKDISKSLQPTAEAAVSAMKAGKLLNLVYHGEDRMVEVHAVGVSVKGKPCIRGYQVIGGAVFGQTTGWKLFSMEDVESLRELNLPSLGPRPGYKPGDKGMTAIFAEISHEPTPDQD